MKEQMRPISTLPEDFRN